MSGTAGQCVAIALAVLALVPSALTAQVPTERLADTLARRSLEGLGSRPLEAERLLERNMSRYFVAFPLLAGAENRQAVLQATLRATARFAGSVLMLATADDPEVAHAITQDDIAAAVDQALPQASNPWDETVFFPQGAGFAVETWDLRVMEATGVAWAALGFLVQQPIPQRLAESTLEDAAVDRLAAAAGAYALLVLRLAGEEARDGFDSYVQARHVRDAVKRLGELRGSAAPVSTALSSGSIFTDVTAVSGVDFRHVSSDWIARFRRWGEDAPTFSGGGVAARDLDGDGWVDLVYCGGAGCRLYRNLGSKGDFPTFEDITAAAGLEAREPFEARMPLPADFDGDGDLDLFVTAAQDGNRLYLNDSGGKGLHFRDVTAASGVARPGDISGPAAAFDADGDGDLDLFVGNFGDYLSGASPWLSPDSRNGQPNRLFLNLSDAKALSFEEATDAGAGDTGWAQAVSHFDYDGDGDQDLYLANDFGRNELLANRGDGTFVAVGAATGGDDPFHGMNSAFADLDRDRLPDIFITNIWTWNPADGGLGEANSLLLSSAGAGGGVSYRNASIASGLTAGDTGWAWGALFFDADQDGFDDLLVASGLHDYNTFFQWRPHPDGGEQMVPTTHRREPGVYYRGLAPSAEASGLMPHFAVVPGSGAELPGINARGLALADFDRDGDLDLAVSSFHDHARLLRNDSLGNDSRDPGGWLQVELVGDAEGSGGMVNRDALGAVAVVTGPDGLYGWRMVMGGEGYLSVSQHPLHFGLGDVTGSIELEITWPGGARQILKDVPPNRRIRVRHGVEGFELLP